jgi:hypothetical protein
MKVLSIGFAACLGFVLAGGLTAAHANAVSTHCTGMTVTDAIESNSDNQTQSTSWQNIPDALLHFTTSSTGCVVITFSGVADVSNPNLSYSYLSVRTLLDGNQICVPGGSSATFLASGQPPPVTAASITHVCKNVAAGAHTVQVQFSIGQVGQDGEIAGHVLTVTHN